MKVFVVNLDRDKERMAFIDAQLRRLGVEYERIGAVDARAMSNKDLRTAVNGFRWWCAMGRSIAMAEVGCALSHYSIYRQMIAEGEKMACILEDDIEIDAGFKAALSFVESAMDPESPQVVLLSKHRYETHENLGNVVRTRGKMELIAGRWGIFTDAYCITANAAKNVLHQNYPMITPCDHWGRWVRLRALDLFHVWPPVCRQNRADFGSSTSRDRRLVSSLSHWERLVHYAKRVVGKSLDAVLSLVTGK